MLQKRRQEDTSDTAGLRLYLAAYKAKRFDFVAQIAEGKTLLVGEGNLSFALSLTRDKRIVPGRLTATLFEYLAELTPEARENAAKSRALGVAILYDVDATRLSSAVGAASFDNIVFQFPNVGSREPIEGRNPISF